MDPTALVWVPGQLPHTESPAAPGSSSPAPPATSRDPRPRGLGLRMEFRGSRTAGMLSSGGNVTRGPSLWSVSGACPRLELGGTCQRPAIQTKP